MNLIQKSCMKRVLALIITFMFMFTLLPTSLVMAEADYLYGDVNGDYCVDMSDVSAIRTYFRNGDEGIFSDGGIKAGDVNGDSVVDIIDAAAIISNYRYGVPYEQGLLYEDHSINISADKTSAMAGEEIELTVTLRDGSLSDISALQYSINFPFDIVSPISTNIKCFETEWYNGIKSGNGIGVLGSPIVGINSEHNTLNVAFLSTSGGVFNEESYVDENGEIVDYSNGVTIGKIIFVANEDIEHISGVFTLERTRLSKTIDRISYGYEVNFLAMDPPAEIMAVEEVCRLIDEIFMYAIDDPSYIAALEAAEWAYESLTYDQREQVHNYDVLVQARADYDMYMNGGEGDSHYHDWVMANEVVMLIDAIGDPYNDVTLDSEDAIVMAENAYANLTEEQKAMVTNYDMLVVAREIYEMLKNEAFQMPIDEVIALIDMIGEVTLDSEEQIITAEEAYERLSDEQKQYVTNYHVLKEARSRYKELINENDTPSTPSGGSGGGGGYTMTLTSDVTSAVAGDTINLTVTFDGPMANMSVVQYSIVFDDTFVSTSVGSSCFDSKWYRSMKSGSGLGYISAPSCGIKENRLNVVFLSTMGYSINEESEIYYENTAVAGKIRFTANCDIDDISKVFTLSNTKASKLIDYAQVAINVEAVQIENFDEPIPDPEPEPDYDQEAANMVIALIDSIGEVNLAEGDGKITVAEEAYRALTEYQQSLVTNYADLVAAREHYNYLKDEEIQNEINAAAANVVYSLIEEIGKVTLESEEKILAAEEAYENLTDDQKILVTNYDVLTLAREKLEELKADAEQEAADKVAAQVVINFIDAIGEVTVDSLNAIETAENAYILLTEVQKTYVTNYRTLVAARHAYDELIKVPAEIASGSCGTDLNWVLYDDGNLVVSGSGAMSDWSASSNVPWYKYLNNIFSVTIENGVTSIGTRAFTNAKNLKSVTMSDTVTVINDYAFYNCTALIDIEISENTTKIGANALSGCTLIEKIDIPASVTTIGATALYGCTNLECINVDGANTKYSSDDGVLYNKAMTNVICYPAMKADESFEIPKTVTTLTSGAFAKNSYLTYVEIPKSVKIITYNTFINCTNLATVIIPSSITTVGGSAFGNCSNIKDVYYYGSKNEWDSITFGGSNTFHTNANITYNYVGTEIKASGVCGTSLSWVLYADGNLEVTGSGAIPDYSAASNVPWNAYMKDICNVIIYNGVTAIGSRAFAYASNINSVVIASTVKTINSYAFYNNSLLENIEIPDGITTIAANAFSGCTSLKEFYVPSSVTSIGTGAFNLCTALERINVDEANTKYTSVDGVLYNKSMKQLVAYPICKADVVFEVPSTVEGFASNAFEDNLYITNVIMSKGVKTITYRLFADCINLTTVTIPKTVTTIGGSVFANTSLKTIYYYGSEADWSAISISTSGNTAIDSAEIIYNYVPVDNSCGDNATWSIVDGVLTISGTGAMYDYDAEANPENPTPWFASRNSITSIEVEEGITSIGSYAFSGLTNVSKITLPQTVTAYGNYAFGGCIKLSSFDISANVTKIGVGCFFGDIKLGSITVDANNPNYCSKDGVLYSKDMTEIICHPAGKMVAFGFTIPATVTKIAHYAFAACVTLPNIVIPDGVVSIGTRAFIGCAYLSTITLPASIKSIGYYAFDTCSALNKVIFLGTDDEWNNLSISDGNECFTNVEPTFPVRSVLIKDASLTLALGGISKQLIAEVYPYYATNKNVTWKSSDEGVAIVDENGYVTPTGKGTATITVTTAENGFTDSVEVTVVIPVERIELDKTDITLEIGQEDTLYATIYPEDATNKNVIWTTSDEKVAIVDEYGNITAVGEGIATIGVAAQDGGHFAACLVTVEPPCIAKGESETIKWIIEKDGRLVISGTGDITNNTSDMGWKNYSYEITSVVIEEGITGIIGNAFIDCKNLTDAELPTTLMRMASAPFAGTGLTSITIPERVTGISFNSFDRCYNLESINVDEKNHRYHSVDGVLYDTLKNALMLYPLGKTNESFEIEDGTVEISTNSFNYNMNLKEITIPTSVVSIHSAFYTCPSLTDVYYLGSQRQWAEISITGNNAPLLKATIHFAEISVEKIILNETDILLNRGEYRQLYATVLPEDATNQNVIWTSDNLDVAKVSVDGEVYAVGAGSAIITATTEDGGYFAECHVGVMIPVSGIEIFEDGIKLEKGETKTLTVEVYPEDATAKDIDWTSSNEDVVSVDVNGNVTANGVGFATITAMTMDGCFFDTCEVEVRISPKEFKLDKEMLMLNIGDGYKLNVIVEPENASYQEFAWSTTDENVVMVDENGYITAIGEGTATVSVSYGYWGMTASCEVTVTDVIPDDAPVIKVSNEIATAGNEVNVTVSLKNNPGFVTMKLMLDYDRDALTLVNVEDLGVLGDNVHSDDYTNDAYVLYWDNGAAAENFTANGDIVKLTFAVKEDVQIGEYPVTVTYDIDNYDIFDIDLTPVEFIVVDGAVEVADFIYGDVNDDGKINAIDSALLARYIANWTGVTLNKNAADINADGRVNALDSAILKRHLACWDTYEVLPR